MVIDPGQRFGADPVGERETAAGPATSSVVMAGDLLPLVRPLCQL
jgi:hypothetical protein